MEERLLSLFVALLNLGLAGGLAVLPLAVAAGLLLTRPQEAPGPRPAGP